METKNHPLSSVPAFSGLTDATLSYLLERSTTIEVAGEDYFFEQGDLGDAVFILESGRVAVEKLHGKSRYLLRILDPGSCFGEVALLSVTTRTASIRATETCSALKLTNRALRDLYDHDLEQFTLLVMNLGREVCRRFAELDRQLFEFVAPTLVAIEDE
jgi:CRP-like cAMP-binding protein